MKPVIVAAPEHAQEIQDTIFRNMSDEKKFALWAKFWKLGKALTTIISSHATVADMEKTCGEAQKNI